MPDMPTSSHEIIPAPNIDELLEEAKKTKTLTRALLHDLDSIESAGRDAYEKLPENIRTFLEPFTHVHRVGEKRQFTENFLKLPEPEVGENISQYETRKQKYIEDLRSLIASNFNALEIYFNKEPKDREGIVFIM